MNTRNKELVEKWVEALRSGKYKQGRGALRNRDDEFCCLGVLCDISRQDLGINWEPEKEHDSFEIYVVEGNGGVLPYKVWNYVGREDPDYRVKISINNPKIPNLVFKDRVLVNNYVYLVTLNDSYQLSFEQIADIIEEEFLK